MAAVPALPPVRLLALLMATFVLGGLAFAIGTPTFQNPDEPSHLDMAHHYAHDPLHLAGPSLRVRQGTVDAVAQVGLRAGAGPVRYDSVPDERPRYLDLDAFPDQDEPAVEGCPARCQNYQYGHPPLWYLTMAPVVRLFDGLSAPALVFVLRVIGVAMAAVTVPCTWFAARQLWPGAVRRPLVAAALVALCGPYLSTAAAVNNDSGVLLLGAATIAVMAHTLRRGPNLRSAALLGALVGAGLLLKGQFLVFAPLAGLAVLVGPTRLPRWQPAAAFSVPAIIGAQWWLATVARDGSLTPGGSELVAVAQPGPWEDERFPGFVVDHLGDLYRRMFGLYGWASVEVPAAGRLLLTIAAAAIALLWLSSRPWRRLTVANLRWWLLAALPVGLAVAAFKASFDVYRLNGEVRGLAPRYLYPALPVLALGMVAVGSVLAERLPERWIPRAPAVAVGAWAAVAGVGSLVLALTGLHDTTSLGRLIERASIVSPVPAASLWLAVVVIGWLVLSTAVVAALWHGPDMSRAASPARGPAG